MYIQKVLFQTENKNRVYHRAGLPPAVRLNTPIYSLSGNMLFGIFMISYAKIWTTIFNDSWFLSLNCQQRGLWLQLIVLAKMQGDTGHILFNSRSSLAHQLFIDRAVLVRSLTKYQQDGRLYINSREGNVIEIIICKYSYWQGLKDDKQWRINQQPTDDISSLNKNNNKNKNSNIEKDIILREVTDYFCSLFLECTGNKYDFTQKDGVLFAKLIKTYQVEKTKQMIEMFFQSNDKFIQEAGYTVGVFKSQVNKLLSKEYRPIDNRSQIDRDNDELLKQTILREEREKNDQIRTDLLPKKS